MPFSLVSVCPFSILGTNQLDPLTHSPTIYSHFSAFIYTGKHNFSYHVSGQVFGIKLLLPLFTLAKEIIFNILSIWHLHFLSHIYPNITFQCQNYCGQVGHILWCCPAVQDFWLVTIAFVRNLTGLIKPPCPNICVLGKPFYCLRTTMQHLLTFIPYSSQMQDILPLETNNNLTDKLFFTGLHFV